MVKIQLVDDLSKLKELYPQSIHQFIRQEFQHLYDSLNGGESLSKFELKNENMMIIFESGDDLKSILTSNLCLEFIELIQIKGYQIYRISIRHDHEFQLCYSLKGNHNIQTEQWLSGQLRRN